LKFIHISDLHLGKKLNEYSLLEDQQYILNQISDIVKTERPDAVFIAGDVYDRSVPATDALELFDSFLYNLSLYKVQVFVISGNHDSSERMSFGSRLMEGSGVHICKSYDGECSPIKLVDAFGTVNVYMLPFLRPSTVRRYSEREIVTYTDALACAIEAMNISSQERNILLSHQFVTGASISGSEEITVGGLDNVDASVFECFDYVALGHIHREQNIGKNIRYCGTPLKYSLSEINDEKSVTVGELGNKGELSIRTVKLTPLRELRQLKGNYDELTLRKTYENTSLVNDYLYVTLTDEEEIFNAKQNLQLFYKNILSLNYENKRTEFNNEIEATAIEHKTPMELFSDLYKQQNNKDLTEEQTEYLQKIIESVWEADE